MAQVLSDFITHGLLGNVGDLTEPLLGPRHGGTLLLGVLLHRLGPVHGFESRLLEIVTKVVARTETKLISNQLNTEKFIIPDITLMDISRAEIKDDYDPSFKGGKYGKLIFPDFLK